MIPFGEEHVRATYRFLGHRDETEVRVLNPETGIKRSLFVHSEDEFVDVCRQWNGIANVYAGINERTPGGTTNESVISTKTLVIDVDAVRERGFEKDPATDVELRRAEHVCNEVILHFKRQGWTLPVKNFSGNGYQLWCAFPEVPITDERRAEISEKVKLFIREIISAFSDNVNATIDQIGDLARIIKVIGTFNIKGRQTDGRPHRLATVSDNSFVRVDDARLREYILSLHPKERQAVSHDFDEKGEEYLSGLLGKDQKLCDLIEGRWEQYRYPSRSEAEQALVCKLVFYEFPDDQIAVVMDRSKIGKWQESPQGYRDRTVSKAHELVPETVSAGRLGDAEESRQIHLMDIERQEFYDTHVTAEISIRGVGQVYKVPSVFVAEWEERIDGAGSGEVRKNTKTFVIPRRSDLLIKMTNVPVEKQYYFLRKYAARVLRIDEAGEKKISIRVNDHQTVTELVIFPSVKELKFDREKNEVVDEAGREYRKMLAYYLGEKQSKDVYFTASGHCLKNPKNATVTFLIDRLDPVRTGIDGFSIDREFGESVAPLTADPGKEEEQLLRIVSELRSVVRLKGRDEGTLADLLVYHSPLWIDFDGELIKGWVEAAKVGDSTTGKSQGTKRLKDFFNIGSIITGETASRTGLLYAIDTSFKGHILTWGMMPLNDRGLLVVDGANYVSREEWGEARETRRSGVLRVYRSVSGETYCRTRLMLIFNPQNWRGDTFSLSSSLFPCSTLKMIQQTPDIARLDFVVFYRSDDVANVQEQVSWKPCEISAESFRKNILWAWSRSPDQIIFDDATVSHIYAVAQQLVAKYGNEDIPLVSNDMRQKIARLSASMAAILHSSDESHQQLVVKQVHVDLVTGFLESVYRNANCSLDFFSDVRRAEMTLSEEEFSAIREKLVEMNDSDKANVNISLLELFLKNDSIKLDEIQNNLGIDKKSVMKRLGVLKGAQLISSTSNGYEKRPKFVLFLKRIVNKSGQIDLENATPLIPPLGSVPSFMEENEQNHSNQNMTNSTNSHNSTNLERTPLKKSKVGLKNFSTPYYQSGGISGVSGVGHFLPGVEAPLTPPSGSVPIGEKIQRRDDRTPSAVIIHVLEGLTAKNNGDPVSVETLIGQFVEPDRESVAALVERMKMDGILFETRPGFVMKV